jgi:hypothetical protein
MDSGWSLSHTGCGTGMTTKDFCQRLTLKGLLSGGMNIDRKERRVKEKKDFTSLFELISNGWNSTFGTHNCIGSIISNMILLLEINKMEIQIDPHTLERALERGTTEEEIKDVIITVTVYVFYGQWKD